MLYIFLLQITRALTIINMLLFSSLTLIVRKGKYQSLKKKTRIRAQYFLRFDLFKFSV